MAEFGEDIAVTLVPDFRRFDQEYRAEIERIQRNSVSIPVKFDIDKAKLKADLEAAARELSRTTEIKVQVKLDTTAARAELARLRSEASMRAGGGAVAGGGGGVGPFGMLLGAGAVAGAAFAPGLVGLGLGAGGAVGAGVLGYQGLKAQAASGTGFGTQIYDEINKIKASFADLGKTAADALGPGLASALDKVRGALPDLAPDVDKLGNALGNVADSLATGLVNVLQNSGPLVDSFSKGIEKLAGDFAHWTGGDQFRHFMQESGQQIPHLVNGLEGLAGVLGDVYKILHPLEPLLITAAGAMGKFADAVAKLPQPVQLALVAALVGSRLGGGGGRGLGAGGGFLGGRVGRGVLGAGIAYQGLQPGSGAGGVLETTVGGALIGGPYGAAAGLGLGGGLAIGRSIFGDTSGTVQGYGAAAPSAYRMAGMTPPSPYAAAGPFESLIRAAVNAARGATGPQGIFPYYQLGQAGISPTSPEGGALRSAITTPLLGGTVQGAPVLAGGINALESRYGPAIQAMQSYRQAQGQVQQAVQEENQVEIQGAASVSAAQASLTQARQAAAQSAIQDAHAIQAAEQAVSDARRNVARVAQQNADAISAAEQQVTQAQQNAADAQKNLTQARADAARQLQDMARAAVDSGDALQSAQLRLAQLQLQQAARQGTKTPEDIFREYNQLTNQQNTLDLRTAQHQVTDAQLAHTRAVDDNNKAQRKGVEGMPGVVAAKRAVADANDQVTASEKNLARVRQAAADAELAANQQLQRSVQNLEDTRAQAARDRVQNEQNVADAVKGVQTAEENAQQADDAAHQRTLDATKAANAAGDAFAYQAEQVGLTTTQVKDLAREIAQGKFDLNATFTDKNGLQVRKDTIDVQRDLYEAVLIAGGKSPAAAKAQAARQLPYPKAPAPAPPGGGLPTGGRKVAATGGPVYGPGGPTDDQVGPYMLSAGEHVWTAKEVAKAGGHEAIKKMRAYFAGLADGGSPWDAQLLIDYKKMGLLSALRGWSHDHPIAPPPSPTGGGFPPPTAWHGKTGHLTPAEAMGAGRALMPSGWSWPDLRQLWIGESGWWWNATGAPTQLGNAYGIPQSLPGSKMAAVAADWHDNAITQIRWGIGYISERYGNPTKALGLWNAREPHWYDQGGVLPPGMTVAVNASTKPEAVLSNAQWRLLRALASGGRRGPVMQVQNQIIQTPAAADALVRMLQFAALAGGGGL